MAIIPYDRITNLQNDQALAPTDPYPAPKLDQEYNAIKITTDDIIQHLDLIQRDDGQLENDSVGLDQLREEVYVGFNAPKPWKANHDYIVGDTVFITNAFYYCQVAHTSADFSADYVAGYWYLIADFSAAVTVGAPMFVSDGPPASPAHGQQWFESDTGNTFVFYADSGGGQWVHVNSAAGGELTQGGTAPIPQSVIANAKHQVFVTQFAACAGNDAVDDSVGINNAITYLNSRGGGWLIFNPGDQARIKNPIILKPGVYLYGMAGPRHHVIQSHIRAAANLVAMVTTADVTTATHSCGLVGMVLDGNKSAFSVSAVVKFAMLQSRIENCHLGNGSGHGIWCTADAAGHSWVNWITGNSIEGFSSGYGILFEGSDSIVSGNYITTCATGVRITTTGNVRITGNHLELCTYAGLVCHTPDTGSANFTAAPVIGNTFTLNAHGIVFEKGTVGATAAIHGSVIGNFFNASTNRDIYVFGGLVNGMIGENSFRLSTPASGNIEFANVNSTGWSVDGSPGMTIAGGAADLRTKYLPWRAYTPVVGSTVGSVTATAGGLYQIEGKRCTFNGNLVVSATTGTNRMTVTLPVPCRNSSPAGFVTSVNSTTGVPVFGTINYDIGLISLFTSVGGFPATAGQTVWFSGSYEIA